MIEVATNVAFGLVVAAVGAALLVLGVLVFFDFRRWGTRWARSVNQWRGSARANLPSFVRPSTLLPDVGPSAGSLLGFMLAVVGAGAVVIGWTTLSDAVKALRP